AAREGPVPTSVNHLTVTRSDLEAIHEEIFSKALTQRRRIPGLDARRADLIPAGSAVLMTAMELFRFDEMTVSDWALREGIVLDAIARHDPAEWTGDEGPIPRDSILALARRCNWDEAHGRQVARLALDLFDRTQTLHGMGGEDRELLEYGALL